MGGGVSVVATGSRSEPKTAEPSSTKDVGGQDQGPLWMVVNGAIAACCGNTCVADFATGMRLTPA